MARQYLVKMTLFKINKEIYLPNENLSSILELNVKKR